jgi:hypothetical protein
MDNFLVILVFMALAALMSSGPDSANWVQNSRTSTRRQRVQRGHCTTGLGARPTRTSSNHQLTGIWPGAAQVSASIKATSVRAGGKKYFCLTEPAGLDRLVSPS